MNNNRIAARRLQLGLSQKDVADAAGVTAPTLCKYERGTRSPTPEIAVKLAKALKTTVEKLWG